MRLNPKDENNTKDVGSIAGWGTTIPHVTWRNQKKKDEKYWNSYTLLTRYVLY